MRLTLLDKYVKGNVLDLCCGTGDYLFRIRDKIKTGLGIDYASKVIIEACAKKKRAHSENLHFIVGNARQLPLREKAFDLVYSFSSLWYIPQVKEVIQGVAGSLKPYGIAILELGNLSSLNTLVCRAYPEYAISCHIKIKEMREIIAQAGLKIIAWRKFQILPFWGIRPPVLKPLLHPLWKKTLEKEINGIMLDEWLSGLPILRNFAFRHTFICQK